MTGLVSRQSAGLWGSFGHKEPLGGKGKAKRKFVLLPTVPNLEMTLILSFSAL